MVDIPGNNTTTVRLEQFSGPTDARAYGVASSAIEIAGDTDRWLVGLQAGRTYTLFAHLANSDLLPAVPPDIQLQLFNGANQSLAFDDDSGPAFDAFFTFTATASADYFLEARIWPLSQLQTGSYEIALLEDAGAISQGTELPESGTFNAPGLELTFLAGGGDDQITLGAGYQFLLGDAGNDTLVGNALDNKMFGGLGDDQLDGGGGIDALNGGQGIDTLNGDAGNDVIFGHGGADIIDGGLDDDYLLGGIGDDRLFGDAGHDTLYGGPGDDSLEGDRPFDFAGNDTLRGEDGDDILFGWSGHDTLFGGLGADDLAGDAGNDTVYAGDGSDEIQGSSGIDTIYGEAGNDLIEGGSDGDTLDGGTGDDRLRGSSGRDRLIGADGNDSLVGGDSGPAGGLGDTLVGGRGNDSLIGDVAHLGGDDDILTDTEGSNLFEPGRGTDRVTAGTGLDKLSYINDEGSGIVARWYNHTVTDVTGLTDTFAGIDSIRGTKKNDTFGGDQGGNNVEGFGGNDWFNGAGGIDQIDYSFEHQFDGAPSDPLSLFGVILDLDVDPRIGTPIAGTATDTFGSRDTLINVENVRGSVFGDTLTGSAVANSLWGLDGIDRLNGEDGNDRLFGGTGNDILNGGNGNDVLAGEFGIDSLRGGLGNDTYSLGSDVDGVFDTGGVDLVVSSISRSLAPLTTIENLTLVNVSIAHMGTGNGLANIIAGNNFANILTGGFGNDTLRGLGSSDTLFGGAGIDTLTGGLGNDFFVFSVGPSAANRDSITDFSNVASNNDTISLENAVFTKLGAPGVLNSAFFCPGPAALDGNDYVIYNKVTGVLSYDVNGSAAGGVFQLATLTNKPTLSASDFVVI